MRRPLAVDLCSGLGGWADGLEAEGWDVIRVDIEDMFAATGTPKPPNCLLMVQDILTVHGSQFAKCDLIVASPPCQFFSYVAMPWSRAKALAAEVRADPARLEKELALFKACFRIQREASDAAGRHIPMVVENVRGARPWVGRAVFNYGSFYLWGDVPALMPVPIKAAKVPGFRFDGSGASFQTASVNAHIKNDGGSWFNIGGPGQKVVAQNPDGRLVHRRDGAPHSKHFTNPAEHTYDGAKSDGSASRRKTKAAQRVILPEVVKAGGLKHGGDWFSDPSSPSSPSSPSRQGGQVKSKVVAEGRKGAGAGAEWFDGNLCVKSSKSTARKAASAKIAMIPEVLSRHIAKVYYPRSAEIRGDHSR